MRKNTSINGRVNFANSIKKNKIKRVMEITYEVIEKSTTQENESYGCYTQCYINSDCGSDYGCK